MGTRNRAGRWSALSVVGFLVACGGSGGSLAVDQPAGEGLQEFGADSTVPQPAAPEDMRIFDRYIGTFQSLQLHDPSLGRDLHYRVEYAWVDETHHIVRFRVATVYDDDGSSVTNAEGFYGHDPFRGRLYTLAAFSSGMTGFGVVGEFSHASGRRITWARSMGADGVPIFVRDEFALVDQDTWTDVTRIRQGETGEWREVYRDTFTRIRP